MPTQVEITRSLRSSLASTASTPTNAPPVEVSPNIARGALPPLVDGVTVQWTQNPFPALPDNATMVGGVLEYTLRDGDTGAVVPLPSLSHSATSGEVPLRLQLPLDNPTGPCPGRRGGMGGSVVPQCRTDSWMHFPKP
jgi:hypothetical protein